MKFLASSENGRCRGEDRPRALNTREIFALLLMQQVIMQRYGLNNSESVFFFGESEVNIFRPHAVLETRAAKMYPYSQLTKLLRVLTL